MNRPSAPSAPDANPQKGKKKKLLWTIVSILIAVFSVWAVTAQLKQFSFAQFVSFIRRSDPIWLVAAVVSMLAFIFLEGFALRCVCRAFRSKCGFADGYFYSAADIYFSAITPSATGGQPASAYFMMRDGIPAALSAAALLMNLMMYTLSILTIGIVCLLINPSILSSFHFLSSKILIGVGSFMQISLALFFLLLLKRAQIVYAIGRFFIRLLAKLHLIRNREKKMQRLTSVIEEYRSAAELLISHKGMMVRLYLLNLAQRVALIAVTAFVFLATRPGSVAPSEVLNVFCMETCVVLGTNSMPVPGAMGISDFMRLDGFAGLGFHETYSVNLELFSRAVSFYSCIVICGISVLFKYRLYRKQKRG